MVFSRGKESDKSTMILLKSNIISYYFELINIGEYCLSFN